MTVHHEGLLHVICRVLRDVLPGEQATDVGCSGGRHQPQVSTLWFHDGLMVFYWDFMGFNGSCLLGEYRRIIKKLWKLNKFTHVY